MGTLGIILTGVDLWRAEMNTTFYDTRVRIRLFLYIYNSYMEVIMLVSKPIFSICHSRSIFCSSNLLCPSRLLCIASMGSLAFWSLVGFGQCVAH